MSDNDCDCYGGWGQLVDEEAHGYRQCVHGMCLVWWPTPSGHLMSYDYSCPLPMLIGFWGFDL